MNRYIKAGKCPFCYGHGWLTNSDGDTWMCEDCVGTGSLSEIWDHYAEMLNVRREIPNDGMI